MNLAPLLRSLIAMACLAGALAAAPPVRIGVLAFRPKPQVLAQWQPLERILKQAMPDRDFTVEALTYPEMDRAAASGAVDFLLTNPGHYVLLKVRCGLSSPLATLEVDEGGQGTSAFGGVILAREAPGAPANLADLRGRTLAFPDMESLGGYQMQALELLRAGIRLPGDAVLLPTGMPHDNVVQAVLSGRADAGFVRTGTLEGMAREGKLDLGRIRVLNQGGHPPYPARLSTRLYPEWPFTALPGTDGGVARRVAAALFLLGGDAPAARAMGVRGFAVPADYTPVEEVLRELRLPPFDAPPSFTLKDVEARYRWPLAGALLAVGLITALGLRLHFANRRLAESMARNRALIRAIPDLIALCGREGDIRYAHAPDPPLPGMEDLTGRNVEEVLPGDAGRKARLACRAALDQGVMQEREFTVESGPSPRHFEARVMPCTADTVIAIVRDVTARKRSEAAVQASQDLFAKAFSSSTDAILVSRMRDGRIVAANPAVTSFTGYPVEEIIGRSFREPGIVLWEDPAQRGQLVARLLAEGEVSGHEAAFLSKDGSRIIGLISGRIVEIDGEPSILTTVRDITGLRRAEEERSQLQVQLQHAQKMESLGVLAGGVAHDMNNVLAAILGLASANVEIEAPGTLAHESFSTIIKAAERGGAMVKGLLSFARTSPSDLRTLDLNGILRDEVRLLERTTLAQIRLELDLAPDLLPIRGEAGALSHAIMNLCVNAVDAMPPGGTLALRTRNTEDGWVEAEVEDSGTGMPREVLERALDPFFTTKEPGKGTGLGLSMVYSTVRAHKGTLTLDSEPGRGTRVRMTFPHCRPAEAPAPAAAIPASGLAHRSILLVDDDLLVRTSIATILTALGHTSRGAASGEEALAALADGFTPDLVVLDLNMPGLGGAGTLPLLRARYPALPVLLATGRTDQAALDLAGSLPLVSLISKPFTLDELRAHL